ncbi:hypothetical protein CRYUN_Cryun09bG0176100 [Craigia yunnanensis]
MSEQLKERQEQEKRLQKVAKTMDHLKRAKREESAPLIEAAFQRRLVEEKVLHEREQQNFICISMSRRDGQSFCVTLSMFNTSGVAYWHVITLLVNVVVVGVHRTSKMWFSTGSLDGENDEGKVSEMEEEIDDFLGKKSFKHEPQPQGVNPGKGWNYRGVHRAIICGKVVESPVQKILRNGRTVTIFTVGTGGISSVYVEGDNETRVYNDSINGEVKYFPEICIRRDGRIRLIKPGEGLSNISFDDLRKFSSLSNICELSLMVYQPCATAILSNFD